jgi:hypothetical protein
LCSDARNSHASGVKVKTASEYRQYARECRELAGKETASAARRYLLEMADLWSRLADEGQPPGSEPDRAAADFTAGANDSELTAREPPP